MKKRNKAILFLITAALFVGCDTGSSTPTTATQGDSFTLTGTITSFTSGEALSGAQISVGSQSTTTDTQGSYQIEVSEDIDDSIMQVSADGYAPYSKPLRDSDGDEITVDADLLTVGTVSIVDPTQSTTYTIQTQDGAVLEIPDLSDLNITENLVFNVTEIDVSTDEITAAPGDFMATDSSGDSVSIVSQGMINVDIVGETSGDSYSFAGEGKSFTITIPCTGDPDTATDTIAMWYYDESSGLWIEEGTATKSLNSTSNEYEYTGTVSHFSTWNMDFKVDNVTSVTGTISIPSPSEYLVTLKSVGLYRSQTIYDTTLTIINLPPSTDFELTLSTSDYAGVQTTYFTTPTDSSGGALDLGDIFAIDYPHFASDLKITQDGADFTVTWTDPSRENYSGLQITYLSEDGSLDSTENVGVGEEEFTLSNVPMGEVVFTFQALYSVGDNSQIITKYRISDIYYTLSVEEEKHEDFDSDYDDTYDGISLYYYYDDLADYTLYTESIEVPAGVTVYIEGREEEISGEYIEYTWEMNGEAMGIYGSLDFEMDSDKSLISYCYICG